MYRQIKLGFNVILHTSLQSSIHTKYRHNKIESSMFPSLSYYYGNHG